jgi:hypothetical protein
MLLLDILRYWRDRPHCTATPRPFAESVGWGDRNLPTFKTYDIYRDGRLTLTSVPLNVSKLEIASEIRVAILCLSC